jgi:hypothetical protein
MSDGVNEVPEHDRLLQETCEAIVMAVAAAIDSEPPARVSVMSLPGGGAVGKQITIDITEPDKPLNLCRLAMLDGDVAPEGEVARIEYEHEKPGKFGTVRIYSIQSVRKQAGRLVLLENFLASSPQEVREQDFRPIESESYAQTTVLKTLQDWARYRLWQIQQGKK